MTDETFRLTGDLCQAIYDDFCDRRRGYEFGGEQYELLDSELGEPFILHRTRDGQRFEVELEAIVRPAVTS